MSDYITFEKIGEDFYQIYFKFDGGSDRIVGRFVRHPGLSPDWEFEMLEDMFFLKDDLKIICDFMETLG